MRRLKDFKLMEDSPIIYWFCWGLSIFNFGMAFIIHANKFLPAHIAQQLIDPDLWSAVLFVLAVSHAIGLLANHWPLIKMNLAAGLFVKSVWLLYILSLGINQGFGRLWGIVAFLALLLWVQVLANVHFPREL